MNGTVDDMVTPDPAAVEDALKMLGGDHPGVQRYALLDDDGAPIVRQQSNGLEFVATYGTKRGARVGQSRWGGRIWDRQKGEWG